MQICAQRPSAVEETNQLFRTVRAAVPGPPSLITERAGLKPGFHSGDFPTPPLNTHLGRKSECALTPDEIP